MADSTRPWEREFGESAKAYAAFRRFRDLGVTRSLSGCRSIERRWSWRWRWAERAGAWDAEVFRRKDEALLAAVACQDGSDKPSPSYRENGSHPIGAATISPQFGHSEPIG